MCYWCEHSLLLTNKSSSCHLCYIIISFRRKVYFTMHSTDKNRHEEFNSILFLFMRSFFSYNTKTTLFFSKNIYKTYFSKERKEIKWNEKKRETT